MGWSVDNSISAELAAQEALKQALRAEEGADAVEDAVNTTKIIPKEPVENFVALSTTYPAAEEGWEASTLDNDKFYRFTNGVWMFKGKYSTAGLTEVSAQLAEKVEKVNGVSPDINGNVTITIPEVDTTNLATKTELANVLDGTPKGTYATLAALQTAYPTGTTGVYIVTADGHIYSWSGSAWVDRGLYQAVGIADKSIDYKKTSFLDTYYINLVDPTKIEDGYLGDNGQTISSTSAKRTDFIPVELNKTYITKITTTGAWRSNYYDTNKVGITAGKIDMVNGQFTVTNANAKYVRLVFFPLPVTEINTMMVEGTVYPSTYIPYATSLKISDPKFKTLIEETAKPVVVSEIALLDNDLQPNATTFVEDSYVNLIDKYGLLLGKIIDQTTGVISASGSFDVNDFMPVNVNKIYVGNFYNFNYGACYDVNKVYLCSMLDGIEYRDKTFRFKRTDVAYIRFSFQKSLLDTKYIIEGGLYPTVIPSLVKETKFRTDIFKKDFKKNLDVNSPFKNIKWNVLGDSITNVDVNIFGYRQLLAREEGMFVRNYGVHGSRITRDPATPATLDVEMSTRFATMENDADIITVFGGINDINNSLPVGVMSDRVNTTLYGALHTLLIGLHKKYIGKRIGFITPLNYGNVNALPYINAIKEVCNYYSIPVLDLYNGGLINTVVSESNTAYFADGLHPNTAGHAILARKIKQFLLTL